MPYIGNVLTSFAVETGNINDQAVTTPKLSATGGTEGQVLGLDAGGNLIWTSDPAGQWVTTGDDIYYNTGNVGIGTTAPANTLEVRSAQSSNGGIRINELSDTYHDINSSDGNLYIHADSKGDNGSDNVLRFGVGSTGDRARIDSNGRLLVGTTLAIETVNDVAGAVTPSFQLAGSSGNTCVAGVYGYAAAAGVEPRIVLSRSKSGTVGTHTAVVNNDDLGVISFAGSDGTNFVSAASILAEVDGDLGQTAGTFEIGTEYRILTTGTTDFTLIGAADSNPGTVFTATGVGTGTGTAIRTAGDMPGRLVFATTADASGSPTARMTIKSDGNVGVGDNNPDFTLDVNGDVGIREDNNLTFHDGTGVAAFRIRGTSDNKLFFERASNNAHQMVIDDGNVGIGTDSPADELHINSSSANVNLRLTRDTDTGVRISGTDSTNPAFIVETIASGTGTERLRITSTGEFEFTGAGTAGTDQAVYFNGSAPVNSLVIDSSGRLLVGTSSSTNVGASVGARIQTRFSESAIAYSAVRENGSPIFAFGRVNGSGNEIVSNGNALGRIRFAGADGDDLVSEAVAIECLVDGAPGANQMPGRIEFSTNPGTTSAVVQTRMTIKAGGNVGIGTASPAAILTTKAGSFDPTDNEVFDGVGLFLESTVGEGLGNYGSAIAWNRVGQSIRFKCAIAPVQEGATDVDIQGLAFFTANGTASSSDPVERVRVTAAGTFRPSTDDTQLLGSGSFRWAEVYAGNATINTSDANLKQDIENLDAAELTVATAIKGLIKKYRFTKAVEEKGDDARIHVGVIAQEVEQAFLDAGLDANRYALFCRDTWYEVDGNEVTADTPGAVEKTRLGIRYAELLAFVIAAM
jgi:hypothetical protein